MFRKPMTLLRLSVAIPALLTTSACATAGPPKIVDSACLSFRAISFAQLKPGAVDDPGNKADSDATVAEIGEHNARYDALCSGRK